MGSNYVTAARIAWRQHGRVSWKQLVEAGVDRHEIQRWLENGRLFRRHRSDTVDCHWPDLDLTVELLSFRFHATRHAFEQDVARRRRSNHIAFTWGDVYERGERTVAELAAAIETRQRRATG